MNDIMSKSQAKRILIVNKSAKIKIAPEKIKEAMRTLGMTTELKSKRKRS